MVETDPPNSTATFEHVLTELILFTYRLRDDGATVAPNAALDAAAAMSEVDLGHRQHVRAALKATLLLDHKDAHVFDELFPLFWSRLRIGLQNSIVDDTRSLPEYPSQEAQITLEHDEHQNQSRSDTTNSPSESSISEQNRTLPKDSDVPASSHRHETETPTFSSDGESSPIDTEVESVIDTTVLQCFEEELATLAGRQWKRDGQGTRADLRRAIRQSIGTRWVVPPIPHRRRKLTAFRCCVLVDVSRSMLDVLDRQFLLSFLDRLQSDVRSCRIFFFDSDVQEVTHAFEQSTGNPGRALKTAEVKWGGGTRIGHTLEALQFSYRKALDRRTVTIIISDGVDTGEIEKLEQGMAWLSRYSSGILWLNPLVRSETYSPSARGMSTALPYVDGLFAFDGNQDIAEITRQLRQYHSSKPIGFQHDFRSRT